MTINERIEQYLSDPETRVFIYENSDTGKHLFSVAVENSWESDAIPNGFNAFWLDSFKTEAGAQKYITDHGLKMIGQ